MTTLVPGTTVVSYTMTYNDDHILTSQVDKANGVTYNYTYDADGRLQKISASNASGNKKLLQNLRKLFPENTSIDSLIKKGKSITKTKARINQKFINKNSIRVTVYSGEMSAFKSFIENL